MTDKVDDTLPSLTGEDVAKPSKTANPPWDDLDMAQAMQQIHNDQEGQIREFLGKHGLLAAYDKHEKTWREFEHQLATICNGNEVEAMTAARRVSAMALEAAWGRQFMLKSRKFALEMMPANFVVQARRRAG